MRTTTLTTAGLLGVALLSPITAASAAAETCRGEVATIVGTGPTITGTEGRDVVVTRAASHVYTLGGDDLVCVVPSSGYAFGSQVVEVDAGAGDDVVDAYQGDHFGEVTAILGAGADTYVGSRGSDVVITGTRALLVDDDTDTVRTGHGEDHVTTGSTLTPSRDVVDTGANRDVLRLESVAFSADAVLAGGLASDSLVVDIKSGDVTIDMEAGTVAGTTGEAAFSSLEDVTVEMAGNGTVTYLGTIFDDVVQVHPRGGVPTLDLRMRAGHDEIVVEPAMVSARSRIDGARGRDRLVMANKTERLAVHLKKERLEIGNVTFEADGLDDALLVAPDVKLVGDHRPNDLSYVGCNAILRGRGGSDSLSNIDGNYFGAYDFDCRGRATMNGGSGADHLRGGSGHDRLSGNRGRDEVNGHRGRDLIRGGGGDDLLRGGKGPDVVKGGNGRDRVKGQAGKDVVLGGKGRDRADGGKGNKDLCRAERERRCER